MSLTESQDNCLEALKSFNSTIVTCRLYPPDAPQVTAAVDRGYKSLKKILRKEGELSFKLENDMPFISGTAIAQEIIDSFPNLIVFRQLKSLGLPQLVVKLEMDRFAFGQLLSVFNASVKKIKDLGGGHEFITGLGLANYFPEKPTIQTVEPEPHVKNERKSVVKVRPVLVACLLGRDKRPAVVSELKEKMLSSESAVSILTSGVAIILQEIKRTKTVAVSPLFPLMLKRAELMIKPEQLAGIVFELAEMTVKTLKNTSFCVLLCQEYPEGMGEQLYRDQVSLVTRNQFGDLFIILRDLLRRARDEHGTDSAQVQVLGNGFKKLMATEKGKAFLSAEKAQKIIHDGEKSRKKNRLEAGLKEMLQGGIKSLQSHEFVAHLPGVVKQMINNDGESLATLLRNFVNHCEQGQKIPSDPLLHNSFLTIGEILVSKEQWQYIELVRGSIIDIAQRLTTPDSLAERTISLLIQLMQKCWNREDYESGDSILSLIYQIRSGRIAGSRSVRSLVGKVQDKSIVRADLPVLLKQCLEHPKDEKLSHRLIYQGPIVVRFLIDCLIKSESGADRIKMIDLLTYSPSFLTSAVLERLPEYMPWFGKRNLIKLLGETGSEEDAEAIIPYLGHEDLRVQREAFLCLYKIAGKDRKKTLLRALDGTSELIKIDILIALRKFADEEVARKLGMLLEDQEHFSAELRNKLLLEIMGTLGRCSCSAGLKQVQKFLLLRGQKGGKKITDKVWAAAEKAQRFIENDLKEIRKKHVQASKLRKNALKQVSKINRHVALQKGITGSALENTVKVLESQGDKVQAQKVLLGLIEDVSRAGNFAQAEKLREWMVDIDSTSLKYIVEAAEIIDREKVRSVDETHLEIWSELYELLSTEEFSHLFQSLQHKNFNSDEVLVRQGDFNSSLFFINSGKVKLFFQDKGHEILVKTLAGGQVFGASAFFDASVWTISAACMGSADISILELEELKKWFEDYPGIESKLADYCRGFERIEEYIRKSEHDRRVHKRIRVEGRIKTGLLDNNNRPTGVNPAGELHDISIGGLVYLMRISVKDNVRHILGRQVLLELPYGDTPGEFVSIKAEILALKNTYAVENDYSVHVKFIKPLSKEQLETIISATRRESQT